MSIVETRVITVLGGASTGTVPPLRRCPGTLSDPETQAAQEKDFLMKRLWRKFLAGGSSPTLSAQAGLTTTNFLALGPSHLRECWSCQMPEDWWGSS